MTTKQAKSRTYHWYRGDVEDASLVYVETFPDSYLGAAYHAPGEFPSGTNGDPAPAKRACDATTRIKGFDSAAIRAARRG